MQIHEKDTTHIWFESGNTKQTKNDFGDINLTKPWEQSLDRCHMQFQRTANSKASK